MNGILTWYKSINHGAVLQAYALQHVLKNMNFETVLLDYDRIVELHSDGIKLAISRINKIFRGEIREREQVRSFNELKKTKFEQFRKQYLTIGGNCLQQECEKVIIGSDMVFSLIQGYNPFMFGNEIKSDYIFSYAASSGGTSISLTKKLGVEEEIRTALKKFKAFGYRDYETYKFIQYFAKNSNCTETIDPVLLYDFQVENEEWDFHEWEKNPPYLLIYAYDGFMNSQKEVSQIVKFARENQLSIVSCGYFHSWCDESVNADPREFFELFKHASYIITDTFHGTIFSIINKKNFGTIIRDNGFKVSYLLEQTGLTNRILNNNKIESVLSCNTDYSYYEEWIEANRNKSMDYLSRNMY